MPNETHQLTSARLIREVGRPEPRVLLWVFRTIPFMKRIVLIAHSWQSMERVAGYHRF